ncbi:MAG: replication-associated recombination protein A [Symbiobacteriaceae bacterium]|nr:replication-associated recombination protein A [Symbiobacteriaceae bacterium]
MDPLDLFSTTQSELPTTAYMPLAARMRPRQLEDLVGQEEVLGAGRPLRRAIESDRLTSLILFGPPGCGKTTIAALIAGSTKGHFEQISAVTSGVADIKRIIGEAKDRRRIYRQRTILFIDEIHRFNKGQQDALLPAVEDGTVVLIGATTSNPFFDINAALVSRSQMVRLKPLDDAAIAQIVQRALADKENGYGNLTIALTPEALEHLLRCSVGDARNALNGLEAAVLAAEPGADGAIILGETEMAEAIRQKALRYDKDGDQHYDIVSAFIKSMRGSDPDAAIYWMSRMLAAGEDPRFIMRRVVICASEDVGNADPTALLVAVAAAQALELIGLPEARHNISQAVIYVASAPKSNSVTVAMGKAATVVEEQRGLGAVPIPLRDASYPSAARLGHGQGYLYAHNYPEHFVYQQYLPDELRQERFYEASSNGAEKATKERLARLWKDRYQ